MSKKNSNTPIYCSFCQKPNQEVEHMIQGATAHICNGCVDVCRDLMTVEENNKSLGVDLLKKSLLPEDIVSHLNDYVIGQDSAKETLAIALYNHYKRINYLEESKEDNAIELEKSNVLIVGGTGSGKTLLAKTLAKVIITSNCSSLTSSPSLRSTGRPSPR